MIGSTHNLLRWPALGAEGNLDLSGAAGNRILWGVAPTGAMHLGYAGSLALLRRLQHQGADVLILVANYHGYLDSGKSTWEAMAEHTRQYKDTFALVGFPHTVETKDFYVRPDYVETLFRASALCSLSEILAAGRGTLRSSHEQAAVSDLLYVLTQVIDVQYLKAAAVLCGLDESPIYRFGLPWVARHLGWSAAHVYLPMCPGIQTPEMHASDDAGNKILLTDGPEVVLAKVLEHCERARHTAPLQTYCTRTLFPLADRADLVDAVAGASLRGSAAAAELARAISAVLSDLRGEIE